jgi:hypothetical protein
VFVAELNWLRQRLRGWLWRKYDRTLGLYSFFTDERLHGQYQLGLPLISRTRVSG